MKKYKLIYEKAGHVYGSESGIPSVNDDKFECTAKEGYLYGFDYKSAKFEPPVIEEPIVISEPVVEPVVEPVSEPIAEAVAEAVSEVTIEAPVAKEAQSQSKKNSRKKTDPVAETVTEESAE